VLQCPDSLVSVVGVGAPSVANAMFVAELAQAWLGQMGDMVDVGGEPPKRPWWQTTRTVRQGYLLGGGNLILAMGELALFVSGTGLHRWLGLAIGLGFLGIAAIYLLSAFALRCRQRTTTSVSRHGDEGISRL
jgi:hypothetical protein